MKVGDLVYYGDCQKIGLVIRIERDNPIYNQSAIILKGDGSSVRVNLSDLKHV